MSGLIESIADLKLDLVPVLVQEKLDAGEAPLDILMDCRHGMDIVGERYKAGKYFLSELIISGEIFKSAMKLIEPRMTATADEGNAPVVVLGTVKGDIHNLGKDIVAVLLKGAGFVVHDLGIDVKSQAFVEKLKETGATILGMSGLLTPSFDAMKEVVDAVTEAGLREKVKVIIGGGIITEQVRRHCGADAFTTDGQEGVDVCKGWVAA
jgi:methanogenic corrinoid protein MtbC1